MQHTSERPRKSEAQADSSILDGKQGIPLSRQARSLQFLDFLQILGCLLRCTSEFSADCSDVCFIPLSVLK